MTTDNPLISVMTSAQVADLAALELSAIVDPLLAETTAAMCARWPASQFSAHFTAEPLPATIRVKWNAGPSNSTARTFAIAQPAFLQAERYAPISSFRRVLNAADNARLVASLIVTGQSQELVRYHFNVSPADFPDVDPSLAHAVDMVAAVFMTRQTGISNAAALVAELQSIAELYM